MIWSLTYVSDVSDVANLEKKLNSPSDWFHRPIEYVHSHQERKRPDQEPSGGWIFPKFLNLSYVWNASTTMPWIGRADAHQAKKLGSRPNVILVIADDMRPQMNAYRSRFASPDFRMHTPNLDALASRSLVLNKAFTQYSSCNPSRSSFMTSRRPFTTNVMDLTAYWRTSGGNFTTLPQYFKEQGYHTHGVGKVYHPSKSINCDPISWTAKCYLPTNNSYSIDSTKSWRAAEATERRLKPLPDEQIFTTAVDKLRKFKVSQSDKPFFLKPHLPIIFPDEFLDLYDAVPLARNPYLPSYYPEIASMPFNEMYTYSDLSRFSLNQTLPDEFARGLKKDLPNVQSHISTT